MYFIVRLISPSILLALVYASLQFVCDVVKHTGKEEYLRPFIRIGLDWLLSSGHS